MRTIFNANARTPKPGFVTVYRYADGQISYLKHSTREWRADYERDFWDFVRDERPKPLYRINVRPK